MTKVYIVRTAEAIEFGWPSAAILYDPSWISSKWVETVSVDLPEGFEVATGVDGVPRIYRGKECYDLAVNAAGLPVIIDHTQYGGPFIQLKILNDKELK